MLAGPRTGAVEMPANTIHEVFPYLRVQGAAEAIAFYQRVFGATERMRLVEPSGRIGHAELEIGPTVLMLSEAYPEYGLLAPQGDSVLGASIHLHVDDCDALAARAVEAGAVMEMPPTDQFYGERSCRVRDPFGHQWLLGHEIERVEADEMQRRYTAMFAGSGESGT
jgi:PhnB protein